MGGALWGEETPLPTVCMAQTQPLMVHYPLPRTGQLPTAALGKGMGAKSKEVTKQAQQWAGLGHKNSYRLHIGKGESPTALYRQGPLRSPSAKQGRMTKVGT